MSPQLEGNVIDRSLPLSTHTGSLQELHGVECQSRSVLGYEQCVSEDARLSREVDCEILGWTKEQSIPYKRVKTSL